MDGEARGAVHLVFCEGQSKSTDLPILLPGVFTGDSFMRSSRDLSKHGH